MRCWLRFLIVPVISAGILVGAWWYANRQRLTRQWDCYRVGAAESFDQAQGEITRCETAPDGQARIAELVHKWATGNRRFDLYLARYVHQPQCSSALRAAFSRELGRREGLLSRWAHYWSWQASLEPDEQIASIVAYLDGLDSSRTITWREVLDLQAVFELTGRGQLAARLSPANWHTRFRRFEQAHPGRLPHVTRPDGPFGGT
ncbi:MAG TPA: hypothetical protein VMY42_02145 [Thermoguttaceae bacterium]|nr:hypothetical protein [Thermoguttaceae bacterium]